jgi:hypothetical protein
MKKRTDTLTKKQIDRQDFVQNAIFALLEELAGSELEYDCELIGSVRDCISKEFCERGIMLEKEFYPWIGCDDEDRYRHR